MAFVSNKINKIERDNLSWGKIIDEITAQPYNSSYRIALAKTTQNESNMISSSIFNNRLSSNAMNLTNVYAELEDMSKTIESQQKVQHVEDDVNIINREKDLPDWIEKNIPPINTIDEDTTVIPLEVSVETIDEDIVIVTPDKLKTLSKTQAADAVSKKKKKSKKNKIRKKFLLNDTANLNEFNSWLLNLKPLKEGNVKTILKIGKKKEKSEVEKSAIASITKKKHIASEPLAKILAAQGHILEAIEMYTQLSLIYPKKNAYFAAQIEQLKKRI